MRSEWRYLPWLLALALAIATPATAAQAPEEPLLAGSDSVPVPMRVTHVQPVYPPEAVARGLRGIVILSLTVDTEGRVEDVEVVRSVPPFDEAAIAAVEQWVYTPTEVDGRPVRVRITVPISFLMKLPEVTRQDGIPELRSGALPPFPPETRQIEMVSAELTLASDGQVGSVQVLEGNSPWSEALIAAVRTWRFDDNDLGPGVSMSFRVEAQFLPGEAQDGGQHVALQLTGLRRSESLPQTAAIEDAAAVAPPVEREPSPEADSEPAAGQPAPTVPSPEAEPEPVAEAPTPVEDDATGEEAASETPTAAVNETGAAPDSAAAVAAQAAAEPPAADSTGAAEPGTPGPDATTEFLGGTPDPAAATEPPMPEEPGVSAVRGVFLEPGVPDLSAGRRPTLPPFARMQKVVGEVRVRFAVDAAGQSFVSAVEGPEELRPAARTTVESWLFARESARRLYLLAELSYDDATATATVKRER